MRWRWWRPVELQSVAQSVAQSQAEAIAGVAVAAVEEEGGAVASRKPPLQPQHTGQGDPTGDQAAMDQSRGQQTGQEAT